MFGPFFFQSSYLFHKCALIWNETKGYINEGKDKQIIKFKNIGDWNVKVGSQEIPGVTGKFVLGVQNEAGQRLTELC